MFLAWQNFSEDYFKDVKHGYDDNDSYGSLFIDYLGPDKYEFKFKIRQSAINYNLPVSYNNVIDILYTLISSYKYPYYKGGEIIKYTI